MKGKSKYAEKRDSGEQMYGPGCCAHKVTESQVENAKEAARKRGHFTAPQYIPKEDTRPSYSR